MAKVVVFGADGFIGKHLTHALANQTGTEVVAFDRFMKYRNGEEHEFSKHSNVHIVAGDFFNRDEVRNVLDGTDYVFHLVSATTPASSANDPFVDIDTNLRSSIDLFEACAETGVKRVLFPSSGGTVYGDVPDEIISEETNPKPRSPYGIVKLTIEHYLRYFQSTRGLDYIVYRIANPYGPGQNVHGKQGAIPIFMHKVLNDEALQIYGDGSMVRDYIYISDLIDMLVASYDKPVKHREYNLGSGSGQSINQIVEAIETCTGKSFSKEHVTASASFVQKIVLDMQRFKSEFNIEPKVDINQGMEKTWQYVKEL